jgi:hypothetical protein
MLRGAAAGAAGTTALNAVTYLDITLRGRPPSNTPEQTVQTLSEKLGLRVPGDQNTRPNRIQGVAALLGLATGITLGAGLAAVDEALNGRLGRLPVLASALLFTGVALAGANGPMAGLGITDPRKWTPSDWASDLVPHLAYGLTAAFTYKSMSD